MTPLIHDAAVTRIGHGRDGGLGESCAVPAQSARIGEVPWCETCPLGDTPRAPMGIRLAAQTPRSGPVGSSRSTRNRQVALHAAKLEALFRA